MPLNERVVQNLNRALHALLERDHQLYVLGQDIADPYGGAFGVTRQLSSRFPDRVLTTPISENAMIGVANGLALCGSKVIAEIMFGDFIGLAFDQLLNFTSKAVSMYGQNIPMPVVVRCPVGANRGYGPTHSQSPQKYFMGIPNLSLYELSPFHDAEQLLTGILERKSPAILFEPKALYPERVYRGGRVDDLFVFDFLPGGEWVHVYPSAQGLDVALFASGGMVSRAIDSARTLASEDAVKVHLLIPSRLYPVDISPVMDQLADMAAVCVAEESSAGGTWGAEIARHVHERMWERLAHPVLMINSRDCIIPAAPHLERKVLIGTDRICSAVRSLVRTSSSSRHVAAQSDMRAYSSPPETEPASGDHEQYVTVTIPKLNSNDTTYVLLCWLAEDGERIRAGDAIAEIETSKAVEELAASASGVMRHELARGTECRPGDTIARLMVRDGVTAPVTRTDGEDIERLGADASGAGQTRKLSRNQLFVAETVSASHREIPDAFVAVQARIDPVLRLQEAAPEGSPQAMGLLETLVMAVASLESEYSTCFGSLLDAHTVRLPDGAHIGITFDAGNGLFIPVVRSAESLSGAEIADMLAAFRLRALRGTFTEKDLADPNIVISWNYDANVTMVKPVIPPGLACAMSVGGPRGELDLDESGQPMLRTVVNLGLTHDHRIVNGREAVGFLQEIAAILGDEGRLKELAARLFMIVEIPGRVRHWTFRDHESRSSHLDIPCQA